MRKIIDKYNRNKRNDQLLRWDMSLILKIFFS